MPFGIFLKSLKTKGFFLEGIGSLVGTLKNCSLFRGNAQKKGSGDSVEIKY